MTKKKLVVSTDTIDHVLTEQDLTENPELVEEGLAEGDTIELPIVDDIEDVEEVANVEVRDVEELGSINGAEIVTKIYKEINGKTVTEVTDINGVSYIL